MTDNLKARLQARADHHAARADALAGAVTPTDAAIIRAAAEDHAVAHFDGLIGQGVDADAAMERATGEADRHEKHLTRIYIEHADPDVPMADLACGACGGEPKPHSLTVDAGGETVAQCKCGRFRKFAAGADISD